MIRLHELNRTHAHKAELLINMGLRGLEVLKIGIINAIFILLFPLQTGRSLDKTFLVRWP